ncbi:DUF1574 domain-containing protein [Trichormus sp. NMC-1]|uniref:DUF1574 domain-containing protein n=1 Tax=Trichormus sp. NMC-1 TaxID=1853259 RepID=UPI0008DBF792|nr:DUF1574 domain-containing protein [Trichormus sp. NMC-1]
MKTVLLDRQQTLVQWVSQATGISTFGVKVRLLGNDLHILCEGTDCPQRWLTLSDLLQALQQTDLDSLTSEEQSPIYQVLVYGRKKGVHHPEWCHRVYLNQLDRHLEQVQQELLADAAKSRQVHGALIVSNESLARQGNPDAIARYLSENLSTLGVAVQVKIKPHQSQAESKTPGHRLWIFCQSSYSPDASLLGEPIAQRLRHLKLSGYDDAVIVSQVKGETDADWRLRVDLTPPETMLKEWARWGDLQAIARLLTEVLSEFKISIQASLKEFTLHIFCTPAFDPLETAPAPDKETCLQVILSQLEAIAPQGILAAAIYGQKTGDKQPAWVDWLSLPAAKHPALATSTLDLCISGDEPAIIFSLERLLNFDMDWRLKTGGIRVMLLRKGDLVHIMCDAPICPTRPQVASKVIQFIRQLHIVGIIGVRVYGRRAGDKEPAWSHGVDLGHRQRLVPEATPEFAATDEYLSDLLNSETNEPILRPDLTPQAVQSFVTEVAQDWLGTANHKLKKWLVATQLFTEATQSIEPNHDEEGIRGLIIWMALGLILTVQSDWMLGYVITHAGLSSAKVTGVLSSSDSSLKSGKDQHQRTAFFSNTENTKSSQVENSAFNASGFTQNDDPSGKLPAAPLKEKANSRAILLAARSQLPSFNARQLDEQLALYKQRVVTTGHSPDVLIIGSSRALRGIDPVALSKALATQGYANVDVFNFGINGATAQVVDLIIRQVLEPSELPRLILWADGARAFNSGREDITFNSIAASQGYKEVLQQAATRISSNQLLKSEKNVTQNEKIPEPKTEINSYQAASEWLDQSFVGLSFSYKNRDQIKNLLQKQLSHLPFSNQQITSKIKLMPDAEVDKSTQSVDFDGFLPLSIRFNPATYYQKHPRVTGNYDNDYKSFLLQGKQDAALQSVLEFTKTNKIPLVFVNMPLTEEYLDPTRLKYEQEFQQYMLNSSTTNTNFIYRDFSKIWLKANDYFSDPSHLNRYGAYEVSQKLAIDPMIPWIVK